jgi:hypothetical protein
MESQADGRGNEGRSMSAAALFRNDLGGIEVRRFESAADAAEVSKARELIEPAVIVAAHPQGGWTHARAVYGTARIYQGWFSTKGAAARGL